jgi:hypothetical protein
MFKISFLKFGFGRFGLVLVLQIVCFCKYNLLSRTELNKIVLNSYHAHIYLNI